MDGLQVCPQAAKFTDVGAVVACSGEAHGVRVWVMPAKSAIETGSFFQRTCAAKKIMVLDLGFLGDTVHLLPALWMIRQSYPAAQLCVAVAAHIAPFMECAPWVDRVWGYTRYPRHATLRENLSM